MELLLTVSLCGLRLVVGAWLLLFFSLLFGTIQLGRADINVTGKQLRLPTVFLFGGVASHGNLNTIIVTFIVFHCSSSDPRG